MMEKVKDLRKKHYFTFGHGQSPGIGYYVIIEANDSTEAREIMHKRWGDKWVTNYDSAEEAGVEKYGLMEVEAFDRSEWEGSK